MTSEFFKKLRLVEGQPFLALNSPLGYLAALEESTGLVADTAARKAGLYEYVHLFCSNAQELEAFAAVATKALVSDGHFWVSYPKKSSGVSTDLNRDEGWDMLTKEQWRPVTALGMDDHWTCLRFRKQAFVKATPRTRQARAAEINVGKTLRKPIALPPDLLSALEGSPGTLAVFEKLAYTARREYVEWITSAKKDITRISRITKAVNMIGKGRKMS